MKIQIIRWYVLCYKDDLTLIQRENQELIFSLKMSASNEIKFYHWVLVDWWNTSLSRTFGTKIKSEFVIYFYMNLLIGVFRTQSSIQKDGAFAIFRKGFILDEEKLTACFAGNQNSQQENLRNNIYFGKILTFLLITSVIFRLSLTTHVVK